ncbi:hypothetical protein [Winogradskyella endarachnes]|uniref:DUF4097 family beta strand repeat protein n=1 Tax=Winogradskyella endarachnes TaxID=2681965 RepID=A0A6L6U9W5_9FLAO|nr:hypothetical protein [Winogradskyella endarachnes]MUU77717.1 hypothetical protein [Winogradskyella endarachnes]
MKTLFKLLALMLITLLQLNAQQHNIFNKSFDANSITTLDLNLDGVYVKIEESLDNKIHFNYTIEFDNYSKKAIEEQLEGINTIAKIVDSKLLFETFSETPLSDVVYSIESLHGITFEGDYMTFKETSEIRWRKPKKYFYGMNDDTKVETLKEYLKDLRGLDGEGRAQRIDSKNVKTLKTNFIIKIPADINLRIRSFDSHMTFKLDLTGLVNVNARNTNLQFMSLTNPLNNFDIANGKFRSNDLKGGAYKFNHVSDLKIASVDHLNIDSEFTTIIIGEVGREVKIVDFNGKYWLNNFSEGFKYFQMDTEYSEINLFYPEKSSYYIETYGTDTLHIYDKTNFEIEPNRKNELSKMFVIGKASNINKIQLNSVHGIIRFGKDFIEINE